MKLKIVLISVAYIAFLPATVSAESETDEVKLASVATVASTPQPSVVDKIELSTYSSNEESGIAFTRDLTAPTNDLWQRIRHGFALPEISGEPVKAQEEWYAARPEYVKRMVDRSRRYLYYVVSEVEKRGMPSEIALLPMIESAYNPVAYSRSHASGIWQFIPSTGKYFGLQQNWWYDGRRDVVAATNAALDYLEKLYGMFGSWDLALAAYNWGEGSLSRAIAQNAARGLPTDYQHLNLPKETREYLPKLQAVKNIVRKPQTFGLELAEINNEAYFVPVTVPKRIDVNVAAKLAEVPLQEFKSLNAGHNQPVMNLNSHTLLLPADKAETFSNNLEKHTEPLSFWQTYQAAYGERLSKIAAKFKISLAKLKLLNGITGKRKTSDGRPLLIPVSQGVVEGSGRRNAPVSAKKKVATRITHTVKKGETLFSIARRYSISISELKTMNRLRSNHVAHGQKLLLVSNDQ